MASPQTGIFALGTSSHAYLELDLVAGVEAGAAASLVASLREPRTTIGGVNVVAGFRPELWASLMPGSAPAGVTGFNAPITAAGGHASPRPSTTSSCGSPAPATTSSSTCRAPS